MDRHHDRRLVRRELRVERRGRALPVVDVQHVDGTADERGAVIDGRLAERREPQVVVGELGGAAGPVQPADAIEERGEIDEAERHAAEPRAAQRTVHVVRPDLHGDRRAAVERDAGGRELRVDAAVERGDDGDVEAVDVGERGREAGEHVGEATGLRERRDLGSDMNNTHVRAVLP